MANILLRHTHLAACSAINLTRASNAHHSLNQLHSHRAGVEAGTVRGVSSMPPQDGTERPKRGFFDDLKVNMTISMAASQVRSDSSTQVAFSKEKREERSLQLRNELNKGYMNVFPPPCFPPTFRRYFADIKAMKQQNDRAFLSELELTARADSAIFPHVACNDLRGVSVTPADVLRGKYVESTQAQFTTEMQSHACLHRCSFVTVAMRDSADRDLQQWVSGLGLRDVSSPWNWIELSFIDNWLLKTLNSQLTASLAAKVPAHRHPSYLVS